MPNKNPHAVALGRKGGKVKSERKTLANRANAKLPRKKVNRGEADKEN
jgi:hypothetical protein